jgi:hypothetical protein
MNKALGLAVILTGLAAAPAFADCRGEIERMSGSRAPISADASQHLAMAGDAVRRGDELACLRELDTVRADVRAAELRDRRHDHEDRADRRYDDRRDRDDRR